MKSVVIILIFLLINCKLNGKINQVGCEPSEYCILNIHIADSLYDNSLPFFPVSEFLNPINTVQTDFQGNATLKMVRPTNDSLYFVVGLIGSNGGDTIYLKTEKCTEEYNLDYYLPKWYEELNKTIPVKTPKYNPDKNYGNER